MLYQILIEFTRADAELNGLAIAHPSIKFVRGRLAAVAEAGNNPFLCVAGWQITAMTPSLGLNETRTLFKYPFEGLEIEMTQRYKFRTGSRLYS